MKKPSCVFVGLNVVDLVALAAAPLKEDEKIPALAIVTDGGGPAATAACAAAKAGLTSALFTVIGRDAWTGFALERLKAFGVDTSLVRINAKLRNPVSMIVVNKKTASRTIIWHSQGLGGVALKLTPRERRAILAADALHFDGHLMPLSIALARQARGMGIITSYDCGSVKPGWEELAANTDILIASHKFAAQLGLKPREAAAFLHKRFGGFAAVTCGEKGVWYYDGAKRRAVLLKQQKYRAVDTTGCGDVFHGAFLAAYLKNKNFTAALRFAQKAAGLKTLGLGGRAPIPNIRP